MVSYEIVFAGVVVAVAGQQPGHQTPNNLPSLTISECTSSGCTPSEQQVILDGNWMWTHKDGTYTNCYTGDEWSKDFCPDPVTCAKNCALDGGDYESTYGISASGNSLSLKFVTRNNGGLNVGSRTYLRSDDGYYMFKLKNHEFTFDVDVSNLPCGLNGALYFVAMDKDGGESKFPNNNAGDRYGTGYCDAQCPHDIKFINGEANILNWTVSPTDKSSGTGMYGTCCTEMDIWESNSQATAVTPHSCTSRGQYRCNGTECGDDDDGHRQDGVCDKDGGDFNPYRFGDTSFFGAGSNYTVDSTQKMTVVTQFITSDGTDSGDLVEIKRFYVQNGKTIPTRPVKVGNKQYSSITDQFVADQKKLFGGVDGFNKRGGLKSVGDDMDNGMVLVMSLWADYAVRMLWLDSDYPTNQPPSTPGVARGPCPTSSGDPGTLINDHPDANVVYSNIKFGTINSTFAPPSPPGPNPPGPPGPPGPPPPPGCPGGNLTACMALCPSSPPAAYKDCVDDCVKRCT